MNSVINSGPPHDKNVCARGAQEDDAGVKAGRVVWIASCDAGHRSRGSRQVPSRAGSQRRSPVRSNSKSLSRRSSTLSPRCEWQPLPRTPAIRFRSRSTDTRSASRHRKRQELRLHDRAEGSQHAASSGQRLRRPSTFIPHSVDKALNRTAIADSIVAGVAVIGKTGI